MLNLINNIINKFKNSQNSQNIEKNNPQDKKLSASEKTKSKLIEFLAGNGTNSKGQTLFEVLSQSDEWLENNHDFIQWLFPLNTPSTYQLLAPYLNTAEVQEIRENNSKAKSGILQAYHRYLSFLGLEEAENNKIIEKISQSNQTKIQKRWRSAEGHNDLRITRVLKCLTLIGLDKEARELFSYLESTFKDSPHKEESLSYWREVIHFK